MATCSACGAKSGLLKKAYRLGPEKAVHCESCAEKWHHEDKKRVMANLYATGQPKEVFCLHRVMMPDPHDPGYRFGGDLVFTDKGVCFAALVRYKAPNEAASVAVGGLLGAWIQRSQEKKARRKAWAEVPGEGLSRQTDDLAKFLYLSKRVLVFPKADILAVGFNFWGTFRVKTRDKTQAFALEDGKKTLKPHKAAIQDYLLSAV